MEEYQPKSDTTYNAASIQVEINQRNDIALSATTNEEEDQQYLSYFSKYLKIFRMVTWILRFANNTHRMPSDRVREELSIREISCMEGAIIKQIKN